MAVLLLVSNITRVEAQITPINPPSITWAPETAGTSDWFTSSNWSAREIIPGAEDNVGIGNLLPAPVVAGPGAVAQSVTLGLNNEGTYLPGSLTVAGAGSSLTIGSGTGGTGLQILQGSTLTVLNGGTVTLTTLGSVVDNFGAMNIASGGRISAATVQLESGGSITNGAGGIIESTEEGILGVSPSSGAALGSVTVINSGSITGSFNGVELDNGGSITNNAGGIIQGTSGNGVQSPLPFSGVTPPVTVVNSGLISGGVNGVDLQNGGSITNNSGGTIQGSSTNGAGITNAPQQNTEGIEAAAAVLVFNPPALVITNSGRITGATAIDLTVGGGSVTNQAGGSIIGIGGTAISVAGGSAEFSNAGNVSGNVILGPFTNNAILFTGGTIEGNLDLGADTATTLTLDGSGNQQLSQSVSGQISNAGAVIKQGAGNWIIDKSLGAISGGVTVNGGTLTLALSNAAGEAGISVNGSGSLLRINQGVALTNPLALNEGGSLDNAGSITGTPIVVTSMTAISQVNNSGAITTAGSEAISSANGSVNVVNSGIISGSTAINLFAGSVTNSVSGLINGTGGQAILNSGAATTIFNAGTINGNITLGSGANLVQLVSGGVVKGNLALGTNRGSILILDGTARQLMSEAVTGTITNPGSLQKKGSGNWVVDRVTDAPVSTNILSGTLTVNSRLTSPLVAVQVGAMLKGAGNVIGNVTNFGILSPGNSPGTLTINGNYTQTSSGIYNVQIDSANSYSRLNVSGHASLDGTLRLTMASGYKPRNGTKFQILTAGQGISGTFRDVTSNQTVNVTYQNGVVNVNAGKVAPAKPEIHLSDGTPVSTTALLANNTFYGFGSMSQREAVGLLPNGESGTGSAISITFDAGEFDIQGENGEVYGLPIAGGFKINERVRLNYEIPLQYVQVAGTSLFQTGLTLDLPMKVVLPAEDQPWSWDLTPTAAFAASGSKEILGGAALSNLITYRWRGMAFTYGNYLSFFEGSRLTTNDAQFPASVDQQIMKNGFRVDIPFAKSWILEAYGIHTNFFQTAQISSYFTVGFELGHHFVWNLEGQNIDLGFLTLGFYSDFGNHYSSGHGQIGSAWRF